MNPPSPSGPLLDAAPRPVDHVDTSWAPRPPRRRRSWWALGAVALALAVATSAWLVVGPSLGGDDARVTVTGPSGSQVITVTSDRLDLDGLRARLASSGHRGLVVSTAGGARELTTPLVVAHGATLTIARTALLLLSGDHPANVSVRGGGQLVLDHATVTSWTSAGAVDGDPGDGRVSIGASGKGTVLRVSHSDVAFLGSAPADPGLMWRHGASGGIAHSSVSHDVRGAYALDSGKITIDRSRFTDEVADGILLNHPGAGSQVSDSSATHNGLHGISVTRAHGVELRGVRAQSNHRAGIRVSSSTSTSVTYAQASGNRAEGLELVHASSTTVDGGRSWDNKNGIVLTGGSAKVSDTWLSSNDADGIYVSGTGTRLAVDGARFDHNGRSGLWLTHSSGNVVKSVFDRNDTGIRVEDRARLVAHHDTVVENVKDGIALTSARASGITQNTISASGLSAFSLPAKGDTKALMADNHVTRDQPLVRVRSPRS